MELYSLEANSINDGAYEDYRNFDIFYGVFSTIEKAKEYVEKLIEQKRKSTMEDDGWGDDRPYETLEVLEDWHECGKHISKEIAYREYHEEWTETYSISKITVDPEFKEED